MRKFLLKEEFSKEDYNRIADVARRSDNSELKSLLPDLNKLESAFSKLKELKHVEVNRPLSEKQKKEKEKLTKSLDELKEKARHAEELYKDAKDEAEHKEVSGRAQVSKKEVEGEKKHEVEKVKKAREEKANAEPTLNFGRIKTAGSKLTKESFDWKARVKFYLLGEEGWGGKQPAYNSGYPKDNTQPIVPTGLVGMKGMRGGNQADPAYNRGYPKNSSQPKIYTGIVGEKGKKEKTSPNYAGDRPAYNKGYPKETSGERMPSSSKIASAKGKKRK